MTLLTIVLSIATLLLLSLQWHAESELRQAKNEAEQWKKSARDWERIARSHEQAEPHKGKEYDFQRDPMNLNRRPVPGDFI